MKDYWLNFALITICTAFVTTILVKVSDIDTSQVNIMGVIALIDLCIIALLTNLYHQSVRIDLLRVELQLERMRQDARYQELKEEVEKLRAAKVAEKISKSLSNRRR